MDEHSSGEELSNILKDRSPYANDLHKKTRGWNRLLFITGTATTFGSACVAGYNIGIINAPSIYMKSWANLTLENNYGITLSENGLDLLWSFLVSIFLVGGAIGSFIGSYVANRIGRKGSYLACVVLFVVGALCFQFCRALSSVELLIIGRLFVGLGSGITTTCLPMYLSEIAPLCLRGTLGVFCSMGVTGGVVIAQIISLQELLGTEDLWHLCLSFQLFFLIICTLPYYLFPESPKYLFLIGNENGALQELRKLCDDIETAREELAFMEIDRVNRAEADNKNVSIMDVLKDSKLFLPLLLVCFMQGGQQLSGINAVFYYSVSIFQAIGFTKSNAEWANLGAGCLNLLVSFYSPVLMEKVNRRPLILTSCIGCGIFLTFLSLFYGFADRSSIFPPLSVIALLAYILLYQIGLGPIPYFCGTELFEAKPRSSGMALGSLAGWTCNFLVGLTFPSLQKALGSMVFIIFAIVCFLLATFLKFYMPETRGKNISDVAAIVSDGLRSQPLTKRHLTRIHNELVS